MWNILIIQLEKSPDIWLITNLKKRPRDFNYSKLYLERKQGVFKAVLMGWNKSAQNIWVTEEESLQFLGDIVAHHWRPELKIWRHIWKLQAKFKSAKGPDNMSKQETRKVQTRPTRLPLFGVILPHTKLQYRQRVKKNLPFCTIDNSPLIILTNLKAMFCTDSGAFCLVFLWNTVCLLNTCGVCVMKTGFQHSSLVKTKVGLS